MTVSLTRNQKILAALGVLIIASIAYVVLLRPTASDETILIEDGSAASATQGVFIDLAAQLEPLEFETAVLTDPRLLGLQDIHTSIIPEALGRNDPFQSFLAPTKAR
ncbi:MAG: hypothetical protein AB199_01140 [Parcubacteria bacterium C7867-004]|nr:MAG: hypothetical protein AB199_01140 [Parcubacteria bacterium C7867-004]